MLYIFMHAMARCPSADKSPKHIKGNLLLDTTQCQIEVASGCRTQGVDEVHPPHSDRGQSFSEADPSATDGGRLLFGYCILLK